MLSAIVGTITVLTAVIGEPPPRTKGRTPVLDAIAARQWDAPGVRDHLDALSIDEVIAMVGEPALATTYATAAGWEPGDGRPELADEDPAVQQAIAYCAANRARRRLAKRGEVVPLGGLGNIHPTTCAWCDSSDDELWAAVSWAVHASRFVVAEFAIWFGATENMPYRRSTGRSGQYDAPRHRTFWGLPGKERAYQINQVLKASRSEAVPA